MAQKLSSNNIVKHFAGVTALSDGCLTAKGGEVVALIGANGSGKSTLCKIITGVVAPDDGQLLLNQEESEFSSPIAALKSGIAAVYQELSLVPSLSISQNIWLTREPMRSVFINYRELNEKTQKLLNLFSNSTGSSFSPETLVGDLPPDEKQIVEILKAISTNPDIIILDEATSSLDSQQVDRLFELIGEWKQQGKAIIFISHRMNEVFRIADRISILRNGRTVGVFTAKEVKEKDLINLMVENTSNTLKKSKKSDRTVFGNTVLEVIELETEILNKINFSVQQGELVGISGLQGQGQSDILHAIFGSIPFKGIIKLQGEEYRFKHTSQAMEKGLALVPGDRAKEGLLMRLSILENVMLPSWMNYGIPLNTRKAKKDALVTSESLKIVMAGMDMPVNNLSGGNAQKVVIGKWLQRKPHILLLNDPTKGVDVGTKNEFYTLLKELTNQGTTILFYSSDDEEVVGLCDRVLVMRDGKIRTEIDRTTLSLANLISASISSDEEFIVAEN
ncbi:sugar ABC transporter ATP-binding protein [Chloroflexota bacterium]